MCQYLTVSSFWLGVWMDAIYTNSQFFWKVVFAKEDHGHNGIPCGGSKCQTRMNREEVTILLCACHSRVMDVSVSLA